MTSNYDESYDRFLSPSDLTEGEPDCFEILSAYIDGEATTQECKQVQEWLDNDPEIKQIYRQLLKIQGGMQQLTIPVERSIPTANFTEQVFAKIDRRSKNKRVAIWGSAIAATIVATVLSMLPNTSVPSLRFADNDSLEVHPSGTVKVAVSLNKPTVIIPKAAVSSSSPGQEI